MRTVQKCFVILAISLSLAAMYGQTQQIALVSSSYPVSVPAGSALGFQREPGRHVTPLDWRQVPTYLAAQLNTDFQALYRLPPPESDRFAPGSNSIDRSQFHFD